MKCNVGGLDRTSRMVLGIVFLLIGLLAPMDTLWRVIVLVVAAIALLTAALSYCPANAIFGINTCEDESAEKK